MEPSCLLRLRCSIGVFVSMVVEHRQLLDNAAAFGGRHAWFFQPFEQSATNVEPTTITSEGLGKKPIVGAVFGW